MRGRSRQARDQLGRGFRDIRNVREDGFRPALVSARDANGTPFQIAVLARFLGSSGATVLDCLGDYSPDWYSERDPISSAILTGKPLPESTVVAFYSIPLHRIEEVRWLDP